MFIPTYLKYLAKLSKCHVHNNSNRLRRPTYKCLGAFLMHNLRALLFWGKLALGLIHSFARSLQNTKSTRANTLADIRALWYHAIFLLYLSFTFYIFLSLCHVSLLVQLTLLSLAL